MRVPVDYPRSDREKFFLLAFSIRRGSPELAEQSLEGIEALATVVASDLINNRVKELRAAA